MRPVLAVATILATWSAGAPSFWSVRQSPPPQHFISSSTELVVLPVVVTDRHDRFVAGLPQNRFTVFDNSHKQDVSLFTAEDTPVTIGIVIDDSGSMAPKMRDVVNAALALARLSNPQDELFAVAFNDTVHNDVGGTTLAASDLTGLERALASLRPEGRTALYDGIIAALDRLDRAARPRRVLALLSDGGDNASTARLNDVLARARASSAMIYTVGLFDADDRDQNPGVLKSLAQATGGKRALPTSPAQLLDAYTQIAREIRSGYTIGYVPPDRDGAYHRIRVDVIGADGRPLSVRTRPGYFAAGPVAHP
jgi:Ca-activated chloride channel family protein